MSTIEYAVCFILGCGLSFVWGAMGERRIGRREMLDDLKEVQRVLKEHGLGGLL